jgi:hypothetical protein
MAINRIQFQRGLSMAEFMGRYGREDQCEEALMTSRWPAGFACPRWGSVEHTTFRREGLLYFQCSGCRNQCSLIVGTIFESTKLALTQWFLAMHLLTQSKNNVSALELKRHLGVCYKTVWLLKHKLMEVMRVREDSRQLTGRVEIDDAYLGGVLPGGTTGRGSENKVPFIAAVQTTEAGQPVFVCFAQAPFTKNALSDFAAKSLIRPLTVVSDGLACLRAELEALNTQLADQTAYLRLAQTLGEFLARMRCNTQALDVLKRQRIVRLLVREVVVGEDSITIRHSIPSVARSSGGNGGGVDTQGSVPGKTGLEESYLLCPWRGQHRAEQLEDRSGWHLPCLRLRQIRPSLPRRGSVPLQPTLRPPRHPRQACARLHRHDAKASSPPSAG